MASMLKTSKFTQTDFVDQDSEETQLSGASYYFLKGYSESAATQQIEDMLNALSIEYISYPLSWACNHIDDHTDTYSSFNILFKHMKVYIQRTDHEVTEFRNVLIKISEYLKTKGIETNNFHNLNIFSTFMGSQVDVLSSANKEYCAYELERSSKFVDTHNITIAYTAAYDMMYKMGRLALNDPEPPYFTDECLYLKRIIEWVYNKDNNEANMNLEITFVSQIIKSLKFILKMGQVTYMKPEWFEQFIPYIIIHINSDKQHIQRTALMVAVFLKNTKDLDVFKEIKEQVQLVSKDVAAIRYLNNL
jgi:hypothetical protein